MNLKNYDPKKDEIVIRFVDELKKTILPNLKNIILYGSRARGDFQRNSDYDFLVILSEKNYEINEIIYDAGYIILDSYEKLASCTIWDEKEFSRKKDFSLGKNILKDGISVYE
jgi:predicted nucleotidyltransferase